MINYEQQFAAMIEKLPEEHERSFEVLITNFVVIKDDQELDDLQNFLTDVLKTGKYMHAYVAFLCIATLHRRNDESAHMAVLFSEYGDRFRDQLLYFHFRSLMHKANHRNDESIDDSLRALQHKQLQTHAGVLHNYAETIIIQLEEGIKVSADQVEDGQKRLEVALEQQYNYAKFHATLARYYIYLNEFQKAKNSIKKAIELEQKGHDYQLRVARYYQLSGLIQVKEEIYNLEQLQENYKKEINNQMEHFNGGIDQQIDQQKQEFQQSKDENAEMIEDMKRQNLQMLGFFTAIISFTVGSFQILNNQTFQSASLLLLILGGVLLIVYAGFSLTIFSKSKMNQAFPNIFMITVGVLIICLAIVAYKFSWLGDII